MKTLRDIPNLEGVKVFLRADFNVPIKDGKIVDDFRIRAALPTIDFLRTHGAKVIIASHIEVKDGESATLAPISIALNALGLEVEFVRDYKKVLSTIDNKPAGGCILLENLRSWEGEKTNDPNFAQELASLADIYVNDAFPVSHRKHASIVGIPKYIPGYVGLQVEKEVTALSKAFSPAHPFLFILGGAKFETKLPLLDKFLKIADTVFVGGALANDFYKAKGYEVGKSLLSSGDFDFKKYLKSPKLLLPKDVVNQNGEIKMGDTLSPDDVVMDDGPQTLRDLREVIKTAKFILWNGTLGLYEAGYKGPTIEVARMIGEATANGATSIVGGGDTLAAISTLGLQDKITFISTAGGAMLDYLSQGTLPGLDALK